MAVLKIVTASNWPQVSGREFVEAVIDRYRFRGHSSNLTVEIKDTDEGPILAINGRTGFAAFPEENIDSKDDLSDPGKEDTKRFLKEIAPFLEEKLVVQTVGHEKTRFPLLATQYTVWPDKTVEYTEFESDPQHPDRTDDQ